MGILRYKMLHVSVGDEQAWDMLTSAHATGWRIEWEEYAEHQFHFLLVADPDGS